MFCNNRMAKKDYKLEFVEPGDDTMSFQDEHVDSVQQTYGFCLLGYVINGNPPTSSLLILSVDGVLTSSFRLMTMDGLYLHFLVPTNHVI